MTEERKEGQGQAEVVAEPPSGTVAAIFREILPDLELAIEETASDVALTVQRQNLPRLMQVAKEDERLAFDFLRCLSGVDTYQELEVVYHLYSYRHKHSVAIKARCPYDSPHMATVSHLWQTANWHEREASELFGVVFDEHPDPRPLLTEEGLGYYILRKSHPLAEIEEWQEDYLKLAMEAETKAAPAAPALDERAVKVALAQKKAEIIKKSREEARAKGLPMEEEKAFVQSALKAFEEEQAKAAPPPAPAAPPADDRAAKIALAQKKAAVIKKARDEARAKGLPMDEEKAFVQAALKALEAEMAPAAPPQPAPAAAPPAMDRSAKVALAQKKAAVIKKARDEARAKGLPMGDEKTFVQAALQALEAEMAPAAPPQPAPAAAPPAMDRGAKVALAQKKAALIKKARDEARAKGMSMEEERQFVTETLKKFVSEQGQG